MNGRATWLNAAADLYEACNRETLEWMLQRRPLKGAFLNTKVDPLTDEDYDHSAGVRGPDYTYGWIQGRGLEALATFAEWYRGTDDMLADRLEARVRLLYDRLAALQSGDGHTYFCYGPDMAPLCMIDQEQCRRQVEAADIYTYSDAFAAKGLVAAAALCQPDELPKHLDYLRAVICAVDDGRFQMDERSTLSRDAIAAQQEDFGPHMILLGAAGMLHRAGLSEETAFADRFLDHVLDRYSDSSTSLLYNIPGEDIRNVGHAIEFAGFAFDHLQYQPDPDYVEPIATFLKRSIEVGLQGPGIALYLSGQGGDALSPYYPWWPMPEAIRACALGLELGAGGRLFTLWRSADEAFFSRYWRHSRGYAYQTRNRDGPVDYVPATPDLDPGYHTALSLLAAAQSARRLNS